MSPSIADKTNQSITSAQKELLSWHWPLGHVGFTQRQQIMRPRPLTTSSRLYNLTGNRTLHPQQCIVLQNESTQTCKPMLCSACEIARAGDSTVQHRTKEYVLKPDHVTPGAMISVEQTQSQVRTYFKGVRHSNPVLPWR